MIYYEGYLYAINGVKTASGTDGKKYPEAIEPENKVEAINFDEILIAIKEKKYRVEDFNWIPFEVRID